MGGEITGSGNLQEFIQQNNTTSNYLSGRENIEVPASRRPNRENTLSFGATGNNLKNIDLSIPLQVNHDNRSLREWKELFDIPETLYPIF